MEATQAVKISTCGHGSYTRSQHISTCGHKPHTQSTHQHMRPWMPHTQSRHQHMRPWPLHTHRPRQRPPQRLAAYPPDEINIDHTNVSTSTHTHAHTHTHTHAHTDTRTHIHTQTCEVVSKLSFFSLCHGLPFERGGRRRRFVAPRRWMSPDAPAVITEGQGFD